MDYGPGAQALLKDLARRVEQKLGVSKKPVCYTVNLGDYDDVRKPLVAADVDLVCFSSGRKAPRPWKTIPLVVPQDLGPTRLNRLLKLFAHVLFPHRDVSIYCDANLQILRPLTKLVDEAGACLTVSAHPKRDCVYDEAAECLVRKKDHPDLIEAQMTRYRNEGYPVHRGLAENRVLVRRHGDPALASLMEAWWAEISRGSRRDQLSLMHAAWRLDTPITLVAYGTFFLPKRFLGQGSHPTPYFALHRHGRTLHGLELLWWRFRRKWSHILSRQSREISQA